MKVGHLDYETRSEADLETHGADYYARHPSTEILMAAFSWDDSDEVLLWVNPKYLTPDMHGGNNARVEATLAEADLIYAHGVPFELAITQGSHERGAASPFKRPPPISAWRCTMAMARKAGLPPSLAGLGDALGLDTKKDARGKALIKLFSIPDDKTGCFVNPKTRPDEWFEFGQYCCTDVVVEKKGGKKLKAFELAGDALATFQFDLRMNQLGIPVNLSALHHAQRIIDTVQGEVTERFKEITGINPTQRAKVLEQLKGLGCHLDNMQAETLEQYVKELTPGTKAHEIVTLYQKVSYAAVKKVQAMINWACPDGRMRGVMRYYGAGTGRWSAGGPQIQNAKKTTKEMRPYTDAVYRYICNGGTAEGIDLVYGDVLEVLSCCIRHFVQPT